MRLFLLSLLISSVVVIAGYRRISASPGPFMEDDSYFYAQIAYNIGTVHRSSFDGIHTTDGYHLAWGAVLGGIAAVLAPVTRDKDVHLYVYLIVFLTIVVFAALKLGRSWTERLLLLAVCLWSAWLMESALLTLVLLVLLQAVVGIRPWSRRDDALTVLLPLVRIDAALIGAVWVMAPLSERRWREAARMGLLLVFGIALQLALMHVLFGHWTSVSSQIKAGNALHPLENLAHNLSSRRCALVLLCLALAVGAAVVGGRRLLFALAGPVLFIAVHFIANKDPKSWYTTPVMACFVAIGFSAGPRRVLDAFAVGVALFVGATRVYYSQSQWVTALASRVFVANMQSRVPVDTVVWHSDGAGYVGYHSARHVINGDGLVNTHEYARRLAAHQLGGYLAENRVRFVVINFPMQPLESLLESYGGMRLPEPATLVVESVAAGRPGNGFWNFQLYELRP